MVRRTLGTGNGRLSNIVSPPHPRKPFTSRLDGFISVWQGSRTDDPSMRTRPWRQAFAKCEGDCGPSTSLAHTGLEAIATQQRHSSHDPTTSRGCEIWRSRMIGPPRPGGGCSAPIWRFVFGRLGTFFLRRKSRAWPREVTRLACQLIWTGVPGSRLTPIVCTSQSIVSSDRRMHPWLLAVPSGSWRLAPPRP